MNNTIENLPNAPIKEVIIETRIEPSRPEKDLLPVKEELKKKYPDEKQSMTGTFFVNISETGQEISSKQEKQGYILSANKKTIGIESKKFSFSDKSKYENGGKIISEYGEIWKAYTKDYTPKKINRIGLRYVNNFDIEMKDISKINIRPIMGETQSKIVMGQMFMKFAVASPEEYKANGILSVAITPLEKEKLNIAFDIDVFDTDIDYRNIDSIIATLGRLRNFKNELFFANILDANERFQ